MRFLSLGVIILASLSAPETVLAQSAEDMKAYGITDDEKSLDEIVPDDGAAAVAIIPIDAASGKPDDVQVTETGTDAPVVAQTTQTPVEPTPQAASDIPDGWAEFSMSTATAHVPPDWKLVEDNKRSKLYFNGDMKTKLGVIFGMSLQSRTDQMPPGAQIASDEQVLIGDQPFRRIEMKAEITKGVEGEGIVYFSTKPWDDGDYLTIVGMAVGDPLDRHREQLEQLFATVTLRAVEPEITAALGGLVTFELLPDWHNLGGNPDREIAFYPRAYSGYVRISRGEEVTGPQGTDSDVPAGLQPRKSIIFDQFAELYEWPVKTQEFMDGMSYVGGRIEYYRLLSCAGGEPISVTVAGTDVFFGGEALAKALDAIKFDPDGMLSACDVPPLGSSLTPSAESDVAPVTNEDNGRPEATDDALASLNNTANVEPAAKAAKEAQTQSAPNVAGEQPLPISGVVAVDVGGVTYLMPEGWKAISDKPDDKLFESPDGKWTILSFWWFPDEPLLGYDEIVGVENVIIDHQPVTRITSDFGNRLSIQNVSEQARGDKKRFIFTLEGANTSLDEVTTAANWLVENLHLMGGFDPAKRTDPVASEPPPAILGGPGGGGASIAEPVRKSEGGVPGGVNFADGLQGWVGDHATLGLANTDGRQVLEAFCAGDGINGYIVAPQGVLGDWSQAGGLRLMVKTHNGDYTGPYEYGGRGDIYIESGSKSASIAFPANVGTGWTEELISFSSPQWQLKGAASVAELLTVVTAFHVRVEYLTGDATAWLSAIEFLPGDVGALDEPQLTGWQTYVNERFGTHIDYPADMFKAMPPSENGDGRAFKAVDGTQFYVFGQFNYDDSKGPAMAARDKEFGSYDRVTYEKSGTDWYVLSGYKGSDIFYRRAAIDAANGIVHVFEITYPASAKDAMNPIVTRMSKSFGHG